MVRKLRKKENIQGIMDYTISWSPSVPSSFSASVWTPLFVHGLNGSQGKNGVCNPRSPHNPQKKKGAPKKQESKVASIWQLLPRSWQQKLSLISPQWLAKNGKERYMLRGVGCLLRCWTSGVCWCVWSKLFFWTNKYFIVVFYMTCYKPGV